MEARIQVHAPVAQPVPLPPPPSVFLSTSAWYTNCPFGSVKPLVDDFMKIGIAAIKNETGGEFDAFKMEPASFRIFSVF